MISISARRIITANGIVGPSRIVVDDSGDICSIEPASDHTPDITLAPGFIDVQVNGVDDVDVADARGADWTRLGSLLLDQGVTSWCPTLVTDHIARFTNRLDRMTVARDAAADATLPSIIGAHLEGPFIGGAPGAHPRSLIAPIDLDWLAGLPDIVRLVTLAAEIPHAAEAARLLTARGIAVSIGHSTPSIDDVESMVLSGATMVTHLFNGMSGVHHRSPGLASMALVDDRLTVGLIADLVHVGRLAIELAFRAKPPDRLVLVTDAVAWRTGEIGGISMSVVDGAPRLADGTLAGSSATMADCVRNVVQTCGISLERAVQSASSNPASLLGCTDRGVIDVGRRGDLIALDPDLAVSGVWLAGRRVR